MRRAIIVLGLLGVAVSSFALANHYGVPAQPTDILRSCWNSAYVNQSRFAEVYGVPVAVLGILGYGLLTAVAWLRHKVLTVYFAGLGLAYGLYLTNIEAHILRVWCAYCVFSLILIVLITFLSFAALIFDRTSAAGV